MKFTDGNWLMRKGVKPFYAAQTYEVELGVDELRILAPTQVIRHRGDTLQGPVLNVTLSSPLPDVIRVRTTHFEGSVDRGPAFPVAESPGSVSIEEGDHWVALTTGTLRASVKLGDSWELRFEGDDKAITGIPSRGLGLMQVENDGNHLMAQLTLRPGENVYGLGERFTAFVKNGQVVDIWNEDGGTCSDQTYKNVPFYLTNEGYGVFVNDPGKISFEVASERTSRVQFSVPGEALEFFIIYGPTPKEVLRKYTALTGRPALPPAWSFGLWLSTSFTTDYDEKTVNAFIDGMAKRDLPLSVFHYDCFWMRGFHWCDFEWDPAVFPDPPAMLQRLHAKGLKVSVWINPYVAQASKLFAEGKEGGYFLKKPNGDVWQWDLWQPGMAIVDFTNPEAKAWFQSKLRALVEMGVDALKTDFGERIPTEVVYHDGSDPVRMHNFYPYLYNQAVWEVLENQSKIQNPNSEIERPVLFARSATAGCQKFPVHWGGDCWSDFPAMAESLRGGLSLCLSGFGFWSHDIGGFEGTPPASLFKRWIAFGLLSSHSRLHGSSSYRVPWLYDEESVDVLRFFTKLKLRLMPYLWAKAVEAHETGIPMMRAMHLEFPDDPACDTLDRQYMLGDALLVAPIFTDSGEVEFYVPEGRWTKLLTGEPIEGGRWYRDTHDPLSLPLLVRPNSLLALSSDDTSPEAALASEPILVPYSLESEASAITSDLTGIRRATFTARRLRSDLEWTYEGEAQQLNWALPAIGSDLLSGISLGSRGTVTRG